ncbi:MAG TPA: TIGR00341 family protein [Coleofasciculaceae cyanobacterium]
MNLRLIEVFLPQDNSQQVQTLLQNYSIVEIWHIKVSNDRVLVKILVFAKEAEAVIDCLELHFAQADDFRIVLLAVEAAIPRPDMPEETSSPFKQLQSSGDAELQASRVNRQELYEQVAKTSVLSGTHIMLVLLSTIIAAIGLLRDNGTIITGAMVIAPLLGPNMALALATTLGDKTLALRAVKIGAVGIAIAFSFSVVVGWLFDASPEISEIAFRTRVSWSDLILAFASGMAGALSFTSGVTSAIVGVMVAVALLPPLVTFGMLLGSGEWYIAVGAMLLLLTNLICLNLAAVITFWTQKIQPGKWWETHEAKKLTHVAFWVWMLLLSVLIFGLGFWWKSRRA